MAGLLVVFWQIPPYTFHLSGERRHESGTQQLIMRLRDAWLSAARKVTAKTLPSPLLMYRTAAAFISEMPTGLREMSQCILIMSRWTLRRPELPKRKKKKNIWEVPNSVWTSGGGYFYGFRKEEKKTVSVLTDLALNSKWHVWFINKKSFEKPFNSLSQEANKTLLRVLTHLKPHPCMKGTHKYTLQQVGTKKPPIK